VPAWDKVRGQEDKKERGRKFILFRGTFLGKVRNEDLVRTS
jgi:hypothetical protein